MQKCCVKSSYFLRNPHLHKPTRCIQIIFDGCHSSPYVEHQKSQRCIAKCFSDFVPTAENENPAWFLIILRVNCLTYPSKTWLLFSPNYTLSYFVYV